MSFSELWSGVVNTVKPVRSILGFYVLMFVFPLSIPLFIAYETHSRLFDDATDKVNSGVALVIGICALMVIGWAIFFLVYFTKQRTKNPKLYQPGFLEEIPQGGKKDG
jgi:hypothetical protein